MESFPEDKQKRRGLKANQKEMNSLIQHVRTTASYMPDSVPGGQEPCAGQATRSSCFGQTNALVREHG